MDDFQDVFNDKGEPCGYVRPRANGNGWIARGSHSVFKDTKEGAVAWVLAHPFDLEKELNETRQNLTNL